MLTETTLIGSVEAIATGHIQVRTDTIIMRDGAEISKTYHRHVLSPGDDLTGQDEKVAAVANAVWTPEVIAAYQASQANA